MMAARKRNKSRVLTGKDVVDFWKYSSKKYGFSIIQKKNNAEMKVVSWALDSMNIMDKEYFMDNCTVTVCLGDWQSVYVPFELGTFELGKGSKSKSQLVNQVATCVHESQHAVQAKRDKMQPMKYLASDTQRAFYEADAYRATMEMHYYFTGKFPSPGILANLLRGYSVGMADRRICEKHLIIAAKVIRRGGVISGVSKDAIRWFRRKNIGRTGRITSISV